MNDGSKPEPFFDNVFKLLAGIAFVSWMIQEYILPHNKFFLFLAIICGLADVFYLFGHKILPRSCLLVVLSWTAYAVCIWLIYRNPGESKTEGWQPPELPAGCKNAYFSIGKSSFSLPISNLLSVADWEKNMRQAGTNRITAFAFVLKNNRIYPQGHVRFKATETNVEEITVNDPGIMDDLIQRDYDFNFSENAFEIVNQDGSPVFQVIYERPNSISLNGIFRMDADAMRVVREGEPIQALAVFGTNEIIVNTTNNADMRQFLIQYKNQTLFKYPSFNHRGLYRDESPSPALAPTIITVPQPDYIEGTKITKEQIEDLFPFGYTVIYLNEVGQKDIHEFHNKLMDWKIDWDAVKIEPNVAAGTVLVSVRLAGSGMPGKFDGPNVGMTIPFKTGHGCPLGIILGNDPVPCVAVLNDDQRSPVFAIGFRITTQDELNHKNQ